MYPKNAAFCAVNSWILSVCPILTKAAEGAGVRAGLPGLVQPGQMVPGQNLLRAGTMKLLARRSLK